MEKESNKPDYNAITRDPSGKWRRVGAGWTTQKGGISLRLDAAVKPDDKGRISVLVVENQYKNA